MGSSSVAVTKSSDIAPVSRKEFFDFQATIECGFTLKRVCDSQECKVKCTVQISSHNTA